MSQISPPIRIVLAVAVLFLAAYMTVLKPKSDSSAPATPAPAPAGRVHTAEKAQSTFGKMVEKAQGAAKATDEHTAKVEGNDGTTDATSAAGTTTAKTGKANGGTAPAAVSADLAGVPAGVAKEIQQRHVVVLAFVSGKATDDRAVRRALKHVDRWGGTVSVKAVPLAQVSKYNRITRGVDVEQSPTVVVIDRKLAATPLVGYVDTPTIDQAVVDALRNSGGVFTSAYLRKVNAVCSRYTTPFVTAPNAQSAKRWKAFVADLSAVQAPSAMRKFARATVADAKAARGNSAAAKRFDGRMTKRHVLSCTN